MSELLYSIKESFKILLNNDFQYYNIPDYQRGYKWGKDNVEKLLDDIDNFKKDKNDNKFYCMQTLTIVEDKEKECFNVVDGQQRLTTLVVLLSYLKQNDLVKEKLMYSIREDTEIFIKDYIVNNELEKEYINNTWDNFLKKNKEKDHQDIYYLFLAYKTIKNWFEDPNKNIDKENFTDKLLNNVKFIINNIKEKGKEIDLFTNLNTGKVSLDGADLIRALIITNTSKEKMDINDFSDLELKDIIQLNEYRVRIGLEIDELSKWWNQKNVQYYFSFANNKDKTNKTKTINFDYNKYPIDFLYKLYTLKEGKEEITIELFENPKKNGKNYKTLYNSLILLHRTMVEWYEDCKIYHLVKYVLTYSEKYNFKDLFDKWNEDNINRESFIKYLKEEVKSIIEKEKDKEYDKDVYAKITDTEVNYDWFEDKDKLKKILILLDIIQIINSNNSKIKFLKANYFDINNEDIEHIFPQTPINEKNLKCLNEYIQLLENKGLSEKTKIKKIQQIKGNIKGNIKSNKLTKETKENIQKEINDILKDEININSIGNLCLLDKKINRSYGNDFYTIKRQIIIKNMKEGNFIRQHTMNCFDKGFINDPNIDRTKLVSWDNHDIDENCKYISNKIEKFFSEVKNNESK